MIKLEKIDEHNIWKVCKLSVDASQSNFVATNTESILEAYTTIIQDKVALPYAIKYDDKYIGFVMLGYGRLDDEDPKVAENNYCLWRFMIDKEYQGKGYGKKSLGVILDLIRSFPVGVADKCWLSYEPENTLAKSLYQSFGFIETGESCEGEDIATLKL